MKTLVMAFAMVVVLVLAGCTSTPGLPSLVWREAGDPAAKYSGVREAPPPLVVATQPVVYAQQPVVYQQRLSLSPPLEK